MEEAKKEETGKQKTYKKQARKNKGEEEWENLRARKVEVNY